MPLGFLVRSPIMSNRIFPVVLAAGVLATVTACTPLAAPTAPSPAPTTAATAPVEQTLQKHEIGLDGSPLPAGAEIAMGDALVRDAGWKELPEQRAGLWSYENVEGTCTASFRQGALGPEAAGMDDREASEAIIAVKSGMPEQTLAATVNDGYFHPYSDDGAQIAHRQFSVTMNDSGYFIAARAFVSVDYSVEVAVTCEGADLSAVTSEVLGKTAVQIVEP